LNSWILLKYYTQNISIFFPPLRKVEPKCLTKNLFWFQIVYGWYIRVCRFDTDVRTPKDTPIYPYCLKRYTYIPLLPQKIHLYTLITL